MSSSDFGIIGGVNEFVTEKVKIRRTGFTLIELLIVVAIIGVMLASAVVNIMSGRGAAHMKEAARGVAQMCHYASALALLRQRPVVVAYHRNGRIDVQISGKQTKEADAGEPAEPIYREVDGIDVAEIIAERNAEIAEEEFEKQEAESKRSGEVGKASGQDDSSSGDKPEKKGRGYLFTQQILDEDELKKEDAEKTFESIIFRVEVLDADGNAMDPVFANSLSLPLPRNNTYEDSGIDTFSNVKDKTSSGKKDALTTQSEEVVRITFEPNGCCLPHRVIINAGDEDTSDISLNDDFVVNVSRAGKVTIGDGDDKKK